MQVQVEFESLRENSSIGAPLKRNTLLGTVRQQRQPRGGFATEAIVHRSATALFPVGSASVLS
jgi:hypothetical protein